MAENMEILDSTVENTPTKAAEHGAELKTEAGMVALWLSQLKGQDKRGEWTVYPETAGWDILLVHRDGYQVGIEAKLSLNAKVLAQALDGSVSYWAKNGPDYRAVLVPAGKCQLHMDALATALGIKILTVKKPERGVWYSLQLPSQGYDFERWPTWCPAERCILPDYIPDVAAGCSAPIQLTPWKIKAIKLLIVLERRGYVTRADMKALQISPTRWCDHFHGFLSPAPERRYVRCNRTPDLKAQHPTNWVEIEADFSVWGKDFVTAPAPELFISDSKEPRK